MNIKIGHRDFNFEYDDFFLINTILMINTLKLS